jgi:hypothetical protein
MPPKKFIENDVLVLVDDNNKRVSANYLKSKTKTVRTPEGRHFVAYQKIGNSR